jgi:hypothetical protein
LAEPADAGENESARSASAAMLAATPIQNPRMACSVTSAASAAFLVKVRNNGREVSALPRRQSATPDYALIKMRVAAPGDLPGDIFTFFGFH